MIVNNPKDCTFIGTQIVSAPTQKPIGSILYLPLKKEWYNMIESGEKKEEYRKIKEHWALRLLYRGDMEYDDEDFWNAVEEAAFDCQEDVDQAVKEHWFKYRDFAHVRFSYGYTKRTMTFEVESLTIGRGRPEWGAPTDRNVFIIKLGKRIN